MVVAILTVTDSEDQTLKPELIVFDLDGTLVRFPHDYILGVTERIISEMSIPEVARSVLQQQFAKFDLFGAVATEHRRELSARLSSALHWSLYPGLEPFPNTYECLKVLSENGYRLGLATSRDTPHEELNRELEQHRLLDFLQIVEVRTCAKSEWFDKGPQLQKISKHSGVPLDRMLVVGDTPTDISSAKKVGVKLTAALHSGGTNPEVLSQEGPNWQCSDLEELVSCLLAL